VVITLKYANEHPSFDSEAMLTPNLKMERRVVFVPFREDIKPSVLGNLD